MYNLKKIWGIIKTFIVPVMTIIIISSSCLEAMEIKANGKVTEKNNINITVTGTLRAFNSYYPPSIMIAPIDQGLTTIVGHQHHLIDYACL
jgi:hypothetical protein